MTVREKLHRMIEGMPDTEAEGLLHDLQTHVKSNPEDNENTSPTNNLSGFFAFVDQLVREIPEEDLQKLPTDLSENLDHYLYGSPKK